MREKISHYQEITYERYVSLMKELIQKTEKELLYYFDRLLKCDSMVIIQMSSNMSDVGNISKVDYKKQRATAGQPLDTILKLRDNIAREICRHYEERALSSLRKLLKLEDQLNLVERIGKEKFKYFVDKNRIPHAIYIPTSIENTYI